MTKIRVGIQIAPMHAPYDRMRDAWLRAEELGADTIFTWDHFFPLRGDPDGMHFEAWTALAGMAEVTSRAQIGVLVTCNSYRNPQLLADMARTVDHISSGRLILGIGAGWCERDYDEYGYDFGTVGDRMHDFRRAMPLIRERLAKLNPPPVQARLPILIGGSGEKVTLRLVAEHGDIWHGGGDLDHYRQRTAVLEQWCQKVGRDSGEIERSRNVGREDAEAEFDAYLEAGATHLLATTEGPDHDLSSLERLISWRDKRQSDL